ncbi:MAG TPA: TIGR03619 family F420-dependent LLM class oxidoreductase [Conexivisphaerales archaeon]|nr:TIGR03619 family F420-dependent LLM class oxidoreductase [Conexivisphaerales archaeon]
MKFGVCIPNFGENLSPSAVRSVCEAAERVGYDSVWTTDHMVTPAGAPSPYRNILESLSVLAYASAVTTRVAVGTSIIVLPLRDPVLLGKQLAAIDRLSGGRLIAGLAIGWSEEEFESLGSSFHDRGARADEEIELLKAMWTQPVVDYAGRYYRLRDVAVEPKPEQGGAVPIWIGGNSRSAVRRAASLGNAWHATSIPFDEFQVRVKELKQMAGRREVAVTTRMAIDMRSDQPKLSVNPAGEKRVVLGGGWKGISSSLDEYRSAGLEYLVGYFGDKEAGEYIKEMEAFANTAFPAYR